MLERNRNNDSEGCLVRPRLLQRIERYLKRTRTSATSFGRECARDPQLVFDLRRGREPRLNLRRRIHSYLDAREDLPWTGR
jgi:2,4-dienoyl-CoA reductase-like NADH-dependent reductase (Old Yellow Enzyme family)